MVTATAAQVVHLTPGASTTLEQAIIDYLPLVKYTVGRLLGTLKLDAVMDHEDLLAFGTMGLIQALKSYDPTRNTKFSSLAMLRIKGSIIDAIRALDPMPRSARSKAREISRAIDQLYADLGRTPRQAEVAERLGIGSHDLSLIMQTVERTSMPLQSESRSDEDGGYHYSDIADDDIDGTPEAAADRGVDRTLLRSAMHRLNTNERMVVHLHYEKDLSLKEISERMRLSQSRISQVHSAAIRKLRGQLIEDQQAA